MLKTNLQMSLLTCPYCGRQFVKERERSYIEHKEECASEKQRELDAEYDKRKLDGY